MNGDAYFDRMEMINNMQEALNRGYAKGYADAKVKYARPHAEWKYDDGSGQFICSECEGGVNMPTLMGEPLYKWCPWCGSDNRKKEGDEK